MQKNILNFLNFLKSLYINRYMIKSMAIRNIKATYVGSSFGFLWAIIYPLSQVAIYSIVFGMFFKVTPDPIYKTDSFILYLLSGLLPWQFFSQTISTGSGIVLSNGNLIKKAVAFPSELLAIVNVVSNMINHIIGMLLFFIIMVLISANFHFSMFLIFVYMFLNIVFATGLSWMLSSINVYLRDVQQVLGLVLMVWMFLTPIFFPLSIVPEKAIIIMKLNPMYHMVEGYRLALLAGQPLPLRNFIYLLSVSVVTLGLGGFFFKKLKPGFAEIL